VRPPTALVLSLLAGAACGTPVPTPPPPGLPTARPATPGTPGTTPTLEAPLGPGVTYDAKSRRDPFEELSARQGGIGTVSAGKLTGIVRRANGTALALVEMPDGLGYILKTGDTLGDGRLVDIGPDSVVFNISAPVSSASNRAVLKLTGD
jgi:hypothetical protein